MALLSDLMGLALARFLVTVLNLASFCGTSSARFLLLRERERSKGGGELVEALLSDLMGPATARFLVTALNLTSARFMGGRGEDNSVFLRFFWLQERRRAF